MSTARSLPEPVRGRLSDGREILLFDDGEASVLRPDRRDLPTDRGATVRRDPVTDDWVIVAPARQDRTHLPPRRQCPLCPDPEGLRSEIPASDYGVAVFENRFPSLAAPPEHAGAGASPPASDAPLRTEIPGTGRCEVVCFTSDHDGSFGALPERRARLVLDALAHRTAELMALDGVREVHCFENRGDEIGVTLGHPHGQIYAYPFRTRRTESMLRSAGRYRREHSADLFEAILARELEDGERILLSTAHTTAFVPFAARWPVEVHVYPNRHVRGLGELTDREADDLARTQLAVLRACDALYDAPLPYVASWHQYPADAAEGYLHAEIFSIRRSAHRLKYLAGSESARDAFITDKTPEDIAEQLRAALGRQADHGRHA